MACPQWWVENSKWILYDVFKGHITLLSSTVRFLFHSVPLAVDCPFAYGQTTQSWFMHNLLWRYTSSSFAASLFIVFNGYFYHSSLFISVAQFHPGLFQCHMLIKVKRYIWTSLSLKKEYLFIIHQEAG